MRCSGPERTKLDDRTKGDDNDAEKEKSVWRHATTRQSSRREQPPARTTTPRKNPSTGPLDKHCKRRNETRKTRQPFGTKRGVGDGTGGRATSTKARLLSVTNQQHRQRRTRRQGAAHGDGGSSDYDWHGRRSQDDAPPSRQTSH